MNDELIIRLRENDPNLNSLNLSSLEDSDLVLLAEILKSNTAITILDLSNCRIGQVGMKAIADILRFNNILELLLTSCYVQSISEIANALPYSSLEVLLLIQIDLGDRGAIEIANVLNKSSLIQITLNLNDIQEVAATALAKALESNTSLAYFYLEKNNIGDNGAIAFANMLKVNSTLQYLHLDQTGINIKGAVALADAIKVNSTLTRLSLMDNPINIKGIKALIEALYYNSSLEHLMEAVYIGKANLIRKRSNYLIRNELNKINRSKTLEEIVKKKLLNMEKIVRPKRPTKIINQLQKEI